MIKLLNYVQTQLPTITLSGHSSYIQSVALSPDGKTLFSGGVDKTVKVCDLD